MKDFWKAFGAELTELAVESSLPALEYLWREGDPGNEVVFLVDGEMEVFHETSEGDGRVVLRTLGPGAVIGEIVGLDGGARSATVRALTACAIRRLSIDSFRQLLRRRPDLMEDLFWQQTERVRSLTRQVTRHHHRAITDPLTQLYNFGFFRERLKLELDRAQATGDSVSLVMFDIDHFKHYNDTNGHQEGNVALVRVAETVKRTGRRGDIVARYGGEEFVALLYGATREEAFRFAESVRQAVEREAFAGGPAQPMGRVTVSGGVAAFPADAPDDEALIAAADANLYRAKAGGRNRVVAESLESPRA